MLCYDLYMRNNTTKRLVALAIAGLLGIGCASDATDPTPVVIDNPRPLPQFPAPGSDPTPAATCTEDEYTEHYTEFTLCVHVEGDGWRVIAN